MRFFTVIKCMRSPLRGWIWDLSYPGPITKSDQTTAASSAQQDGQTQIAHTPNFKETAGQNLASSGHIPIAIEFTTR